MEGGPIDVLTGDYLAELTMSILWRTRQRDPDKGYASTFVTQMEQVLGTCLDRGIKIVSNAGGINPAGLAERLAKLAADLGLSPVSPMSMATTCSRVWRSSRRMATDSSTWIGASL